MNFIQHSKEEFIQQLKETELSGFKGVYPYKNANIEIRTLSFKDMMPTQYYYIETTLYKLRKMFIENYSKIDILNMDGYITFDSNNLNLKLALTPPIVEYVDGKPLLIDGLHRVLLSKNLGKFVSCAVITNSNEKYKTYALANSDGWNSLVKFKNEVPAGFWTRDKRYPKNEYRKYSRVFRLDGTTLIPRKHSYGTPMYQEVVLANLKGNIK